MIVNKDKDGILKRVGKRTWNFGAGVVSIPFLAAAVVTAPAVGAATAALRASYIPILSRFPVIRAPGRNADSESLTDTWRRGIKQMWHLDGLQAEPGKGQSMVHGAYSVGYGTVKTVTSTIKGGIGGIFKGPVNFIKSKWGLRSIAAMAASGAAAGAAIGAVGGFGIGAIPGAIGGAIGGVVVGVVGVAATGVVAGPFIGMRKGWLKGVAKAKENLKNKSPEGTAPKASNNTTNTLNKDNKAAAKELKTHNPLDGPKQGRSSQYINISDFRNIAEVKSSHTQTIEDIATAYAKTKKVNRPSVKKDKSPASVSLSFQDKNEPIQFLTKMASQEKSFLAESGSGNDKKYHYSQGIGGKEPLKTFDSAEERQAYISENLPKPPASNKPPAKSGDKQSEPKYEARSSFSR